MSTEHPNNRDQLNLHPSEPEHNLNLSPLDKLIYSAFDELKEELSSKKALSSVEVEGPSSSRFGSIDPYIFELNLNSILEAKNPFSGMPDVAWRVRQGFGSIQVSEAARKRYGLTPKTQAEAYPAGPVDLTRNFPLIPNVHVTIAEPEEMGDIKTSFDRAGLKNNILVDANKPWSSAIEIGQIYIFLYPDTSVLDTNEEQYEFIKNMLGDSLTPERDRKIRADGGYPNLLAYTLLDLTMRASQYSLDVYNDVFAEELEQKNGHSHSDPMFTNHFAANHLLQMVAYGTHGTLCDKGF